MTASLSLSGISLEFNAIPVLDDVSFTVRPGEIHALIGPNGAGKSSCFNVATGLYTARSGTVRLDGTDITSLAPHRRQQAGMARTFQNLMLVPDLTVRDNLTLNGPRRTRRGLVSSALRLPAARRDEAIDAARVEETAALIGLQHVLDETTAELPYGKRKHVEIARALCSEPKILMLDEPAAGLSESETAELAELLDSLVETRGITVLIVEHHVGLVMAIADTVTVLSAGRLVASGPPHEIEEHPEVLTSYLGTPDPAGVDTAPGSRRPLV